MSKSSLLPVIYSGERFSGKWDPRTPHAAAAAALDDVASATHLADLTKLELAKLAKSDQAKKSRRLMSCSFKGPTICFLCLSER